MRTVKITSTHHIGVANTLEFSTEVILDTDADAFEAGQHAGWVLNSLLQRLAEAAEEEDES